MQTTKWNDEYYAVEKSIGGENLSIDWTSFRCASSALEYVRKKYGVEFSRKQKRDFRKAYQTYLDTIKEQPLPEEEEIPF